MSISTPPTLLTLPSELRNIIYQHIFLPEPHLKLTSTALLPTNTIAGVLKPQYDREEYLLLDSTTRELRVLQTCRQIHDEAHMLAVSLTRFYVIADAAHPTHFSSQISHIRPARRQAIRDITLTARISKLRALNESWCGLPFGDPTLDLDRLTIVPKRPDANYSAYAEIAYHSQAHILAHTFTETFKTLRHVKVVRVENQNCFSNFFWSLLYKAMIFRMWNWGGHSCGVRFLESDESVEPGGEWFMAWLKDDVEGHDVGHEMTRFLGNARPSIEPVLAAI